MLITGSKRWALLHENLDAPEPDMDSLLARLEEVDLVLIEGFKSYPHDKLEVHRPTIGKPLLAAEDSSVVAVATNETIDGVDLPLLELDNIPAVADFIVAHCGLGGGAKDNPA